LSLVVVFIPMQFLRPRIHGCLCALLALSLVIAGGCRRTSPSPATRPNAAPPAASTPIAVRTEIGFGSRQKFLDHFEKHGREFGAIRANDYLRLAQELRDRPVGPTVLEAVRRDGVITRFDREGGAFLAFNSDGTIRTFFRPNDGEAYFRRQSKR
jgi:pyocin large subunit-like protein